MNSSTPYEPSIFYEIGARFRKLLEDRIERLESDADADELALAAIVHADHQRRHQRLIQVERAEALRLRIFLDKTRVRGAQRDGD
jgi:hypothetical protein